MKIQATVSALAMAVLLSACSSDEPLAVDPAAAYLPEGATATELSKLGSGKYQGDFQVSAANNDAKEDATKAFKHVTGKVDLDLNAKKDEVTGALTDVKFGYGAKADTLSEDLNAQVDIKAAEDSEAFAGKWDAKMLGVAFEGDVLVGGEDEPTNFDLGFTVKGAKLEGKDYLYGDVDGNLGKDAYQGGYHAAFADSQD